MTLPPIPSAAARSAQETAAPTGRVVAVLGPTNTGKTFLAMERMLAHRTGMIGFPLRLLARENYDKVVRLKGEKAVALVTGEEKIIPPHAQYWICTVESMPLDRSVQFLCVDEIQLCADGERGHIFTDRLLHARGTEETMFLGSDTVRGLIQKLVPRVEHISRPRFSNLTYAGQKKLTKLPPRSAIVAFSTTEVYGLAEMVRRSRGGTAVVLGALSPRTRNAQVALYQSGDVDYLVATDAIGMGLNMDVDHVWFARLSKFDGVQPRRLRPTEVAQIAGRAGRHLTDGTFGTTWDCPPMDAETVTAVEGHSFPSVQQLMWRNSRLDFRSIEALTTSLEERPSSPVLIRSREADDQMALQVLGKEEEIRAKARHPEAVRLLWEVCQVPDFRKVMSDQHTRLLGQMFLYLTGPGRKLPPDWMASQVGRLDRTEGDIDALVSRIAHVRTFTYVSHRADWLSDPRHWQELTRGIEDRLSDALHERLTQRFVDKRSAGLVKSLRAGRDLIGMVTKTGEVMVEGHAVGHLTGLQFTLDAEVSPEDQRALMTAARKSLKDEIATRVQQVEQAGDDAFSLDPGGQVVWQGSALARLASGASALAPTLKPLVSEDLLDSGQRDRVMARAAAWVKAHVEAVLGPLQKLETMAELEGPARGIAFQVAEALGVVPRRTLDPLIRPLTKEQRYQLAKAGLRLGFSHVFLPALAKPKAVALRAQLWAVRHGQSLPVTVPPPGRVSVPAGEMDPRMLEAVGYPRIGHLAIRVDMLDRLEKELAQRCDAKGRVRTIADLSPLIGTSNEDLAAVLAGLNWQPVDVPASELTEPAKPAPAAAPAVAAPAPDDATAADAVVQAADAAEEADVSAAETVEAAAPEETVPETAAPEAAVEDDGAGEAVAETDESVDSTLADSTLAEAPAEGDADSDGDADGDDTTEGAESEEGAGTDAAAPDAAVPAAVPMVTVWVRRRPPRPKTQKRRPKRRPGAPGAEGEGQRQAVPADGRRREGGQREGGQRRDDRPRPDRPPGDRPPGDRPQGDRPQGDRPH
ncbi:MAG: ATP-dependent helicase MgpS, partial [Pseudomonadota bacterium]